MARARAAMALGVLVLGTGAALAQPRPVPVTCGRDLFQLDGEMHRQLRLMQSAYNADTKTQCGVWRDHVTFLRKARGIFATCQTGRQREENVGQMDGSIADFRVLLVQRCGGG